MKKNDLRNGAIVVLRDGCLGFYRADEDVIIYQSGGYDTVDDMFDDNLTAVLDTEDADIMQVYRTDGGVISFSDYEEGDLVYERDETWIRPEKTADKPASEAVKEQQIRAKQKTNSIWILAQAFYGNRTSTKISPEEIDYFILGHLSTEIKVPDGKGGLVIRHYEVEEKMDRSIIRIPGSENVVLIYNKYQEEEWLEKKERHYKERGYILKPLASIPEMDIVLYSRCIACRQNADGSFGSLEGDDYKIVMKYLAE